jgi:hypothetical protein
MFDMLNITSEVVVGQPLSLQLNSSAASYADLTGNNTGWCVQLVWPDGSSADLGLMADWSVRPGGVYSWRMTVSGSNLTQVRGGVAAGRNCDHLVSTENENRVMCLLQACAQILCNHLYPMQNLTHAEPRCCHFSTCRLASTR